MLSDLRDRVREGKVGQPMKGDGASNHMFRVASPSCQSLVSGEHQESLGSQLPQCHLRTMGYWSAIFARPKGSGLVCICVKRLLCCSMDCMDTDRDRQVTETDRQTGTKTHTHTHSYTDSPA